MKTSLRKVRVLIIFAFLFSLTSGHTLNTIKAQKEIQKNVHLYKKEE